jgi:hypothetical protein
LAHWIVTIKWLLSEPNIPPCRYLDLRQDLVILVTAMVNAEDFETLEELETHLKQAWLMVGQIQSILSFQLSYIDPAMTRVIMGLED